MSGDTDFLLLYQELGLSPNRCSVDEFKRAYRRRVSVLHPDHSPRSSDESVCTDAMQRLTTLYGAAIAFERRFGRLPGSAPNAPRRGPISSPAPSPQQSAASFHPTSLARHRAAPSPKPKTLHKRVMLALLILLALAWAVWGAGTIAQ